MFLVKNLLILYNIINKLKKVGIKMCFGIFKRRKAKKAEEQKQVEKKVKAKPVETKKETVQAKPAAGKEVSKPAEKPANEEPVKQEVKDIYHVSLNKDEKSPNFKKWRVRKQGSQKTIQYFETQKEAIDFAQDLANKADGSIVIHKVDGKIRKQTY